MEDRWNREVELQKMFGLSPKESEYIVCSENGMSAKEIAGYYGVSVNTVRTTIHRGHVKMTANEEVVNNVTFVILKGNAEVSGAAIKQNAMKVILKFIEKALDVKYSEGQYTYYIAMPDELGDAQWLKDKVFRYVDIYGAYSEKEAEKRAEKAFNIYAEANFGGSNRVGTGIIRRYLDEMYMQYDRIVEKAE